MLAKTFQTRESNPLTCFGVSPDGVFQAAQLELLCLELGGGSFSRGVGLSPPSWAEMGGNPGWVVRLQHYLG